VLLDAPPPRVLSDDEGITMLADGDGRGARTRHGSLLLHASLADVDWGLGGAKGDGGVAGSRSWGGK